MIITVKLGPVQIVVDEKDQGDRTVTMRFGDQNKNIHETIKVMAEECKSLYIAFLKGNSKE